MTCFARVLSCLSVVLAAISVSFVPGAASSKLDSALTAVGEDGLTFREARMEMACARERYRFRMSISLSPPDLRDSAASDFSFGVEPPDGDIAAWRSLMKEAASWITSGFDAVLAVVGLRVVAVFGTGFFPDVFSAGVAREGIAAMSVFLVTVLGAFLEADAVCGAAEPSIIALLDPDFGICRVLVVLAGFTESSGAASVPSGTVEPAFGLTVALVVRGAAVRVIVVVRLRGTAASPLAMVLVVLVFRDISSVRGGYHICRLRIR